MVEDDEEHEGYAIPKLVENWTEGQDYDFEVNVTTPPIRLQEKDCIVKNNTIVENVEPDQNFDGLSNVNVYNQVVVPSLETLNNKRIYSEGLVTVENLMKDSSTNQGITKESTLNFDLYVPTVTFNTITNNNVNYTLSQLTQDQSDYFSKDSIIKANISEILPTCDLSKFRIRYNKNIWTNGGNLNQIRANSSMSLITPTWKKWNNLKNAIPMNAANNIVLLNKINGENNLWEFEIIDFGEDGTSFYLPGDVIECYYFYYKFNGIGRSQNFLTYETSTTTIETLFKYGCDWGNGSWNFIQYSMMKKMILNIDQSF